MKVLHWRYFPTRIPYTWTAITWLLVDRLHIQGIPLGVIYTIGAIVWTVCLWAVVKQKLVGIKELE